MSCNHQSSQTPLRRSTCFLDRSRFGRPRTSGFPNQVMWAARLFCGLDCGRPQNGLMVFLLKPQKKGSAKHRQNPSPLLPSPPPRVPPTPGPCVRMKRRTRHRLLDSCKSWQFICHFWRSEKGTKWRESCTRVAKNWKWFLSHSQLAGLPGLPGGSIIYEGHLFALKGHL